jgi:hypothetical protein
MPDVYGPFDTATWTQSQWYRDAALARPSGVFPGELGLTVAGLTVTMGLGRAVVRGAGYERTDTPWSTTLATNTNANPRIDRLVLRRDLAAGTVGPTILQGTPAASPVANTLSENENAVWHLPLHSFRVPGGSGTTLTNITDERYSPITAQEVQSGTVSITPTAANTPTSVAVTFPRPFRATVRAVQVTPNTTVAGTVVTGWGATGLTATGFTAWVTRASTASTDLFWTVHAF